jgi:hypothetical protein
MSHTGVGQGFRRDRSIRVTTRARGLSGLDTNAMWFRSPERACNEPVIFADPVEKAIKHVFRVENMNRSLLC